IAIDQNLEALKQLQAASRYDSALIVVGSSFETIRFFGDAVYFEFCLHEMADPMAALNRASAFAPEIVVFDHLPGSDWVFQTAEENQVRRSDEAMERFGVRRRQVFRTQQRFRDHPELLARVSVQGATAVRRTQRFASTVNIVIPMDYQLV